MREGAPMGAQVPLRRFGESRQDRREGGREAHAGLRRSRRGKGRHSGGSEKRRGGEGEGRRAWREIDGKKMEKINLNGREKRLQRLNPIRLIGKGIVFRKNSHLHVYAYSDADWAGCPIDRRSTAGYFTFVGGNLVTWKSKKQNVVSLSSAESEFRGMVKAICELLWLKKFLTELGFEPTSEMKLFCDNKASINMAHNPVQHERTKHVEIDRHFIKEKLETKIISMPFVRSNEQLADILTKPVMSRIFSETVDKLGMKDLYVPT